MKNTDEFKLFLEKLESKLELLPDKPEETPETTLMALWHLANGARFSVEMAAKVPLQPLIERNKSDLEKLIDDRLSGIPLAHILQRQQFMGHEFIVGPEALVPRKETELLAQAAIEQLDNIIAEKGLANVVDICTGAGNIALSLAKYQPCANIYASDLSEGAIKIAELNKQNLGLTTQVNFFVGDLLSPFESTEYYGQIDMLTCNPPYISSKKLDLMPGEIVSHEPKLAFDGGPFGLNILNRVLREAPKYLCQNGWLIFEVGLGQGEPLLKRLEKSGDYRKAQAVKDHAGDIRVLMLQV